MRLVCCADNPLRSIAILSFQTKLYWYSWLQSISAFIEYAIYASFYLKSTLLCITMYFVSLLTALISTFWLDALMQFTCVALRLAACVRASPHSCSTSGISFRLFLIPSLHHHHHHHQTTPNQSQRCEIQKCDWVKHFPARILVAICWWNNFGWVWKIKSSVAAKRSLHEAPSSPLPAAIHAGGGKLSNPCRNQEWLFISTVSPERMVKFGHRQDTNVCVCLYDCFGS